MSDRMAPPTRRKLPRFFTARVLNFEPLHEVKLLSSSMNKCWNAKNIWCHNKTKTCATSPPSRQKKTATHNILSKYKFVEVDIGPLAGCHLAKALLVHRAIAPLGFGLGPLRHGFDASEVFIKQQHVMSCFDFIFDPFRTNNCSWPNTAVQLWSLDQNWVTCTDPPNCHEQVLVRLVSKMRRIQYICSLSLLV